MTELMVCAACGAKWFPPNWKAAGNRCPSCRNDAGQLREFTDAELEA